MFTGIVTSIGTVADAERKGNARRFTIATDLDTAAWKIGCSVACAGVCLTVVEIGKGRFTVEVSPETLACTTLGAWENGARINLEPALKLGDELGGHIVTGHVDGVGRVIGVESLELSGHVALQIETPKAILPLIAQKGSITVDGVSLTVNTVKGKNFTVNIIPHTLSATTLGALKQGDPVNLEADMLARYVARIKECP